MTNQRRLGEVFAFPGHRILFYISFLLYIGGTKWNTQTISAALLPFLSLALSFIFIFFTSSAPNSLESKTLPRNMGKKKKGKNQKSSVYKQACIAQVVSKKSLQVHPMSLTTAITRYCIHSIPNSFPYQLENPNQTSALTHLHAFPPVYSFTFGARNDSCWLLQNPACVGIPETHYPPPD